MGDRYELDLDCAYCKERNNDIWFAPTCNNFTFKCIKCKKVNYINSSLKAVKIEEVTLKDIEDSFFENNKC